jgi:hypothetical protein
MILLSSKYAVQAIAVFWSCFKQSEKRTAFHRQVRYSDMNVIAVIITGITFVYPIQCLLLPYFSCTSRPLILLPNDMALTVKRLANVALFCPRV